MGSIIKESYRSCDQQQHQQHDVPGAGALFRDVAIASLIENQARLQPSRVCLVSSSATFDYASLWNLALVNARRLSQHGVCQGSRVAIVSESSPAAVVALLAVIKVGAVAVPLSSSLPEARIQQMAQIGGLTHWIALTPLSQQLSLPSLSQVTLDLELQAPQPLLEHGSPPGVDAHAPALAIFTSGSTGKPKGVVHSHASLSTMACSVAKALRLGPPERNFLFPAFGWAVNVIDSLSALVAGACLCLPTETEKSQGLEEAICRFEATRMTMPSSVLGIMDPSAVPTLTSIVLAGEPMHPDLVRNWSPHVTIYWNYGSSETLMVLAGNAVQRDSDTLNAGHPLPSCRCYIVDDDGNRLSPGHAGQLMVESHTNSMGHFEDGRIRRRERGPGGCIIVPSGDLFEQDVGDAAFVHRGRMDSQLKLAGQRFEPQEVENKLWLALKGVKELAATVATLKGNARGPALVVVVVLECIGTAGRLPNSGRLDCEFERLVQTLPAYMVPMGGLVVDNLPRLHNGKLNRRGVASLAEQKHVADLLDLRSPQADEAVDHDACLTDKVALVWATVLGLDLKDVKAGSSFFLLGGNSLYAMRACKMLRQLGILVSVSDFFLNPALGGMVKMIATQSNTRCQEAQEPSEDLPSPSASGGPVSELLLEMAAQQCKVPEEVIEDIYPCTPMQAALMTLSEVQDGAYVAEHTFRLPASWSRAGFIDAWLRVAGATPMLRSRIVRQDNGRLYNVTMRFDQDAALPFEALPCPSPMTCGSQLFLHSLDVDDGSDGLTWRWRIHHSIYDRWSTSYVLEMVQKEYHRQGTAYATPFSLFAGAVVKQQQSDDAKAFWHSRLESFTGSVFPQLPLDHFICRTSSSVAFECKMQRQRCGTTQATSLQAALALLISKMHGESDVVFGMTVHGRAWSECPDAETVVGPAIATVPVRIQLDGRMQVGDLLRHVQTQAALMSDYEHYALQDIKSIGPGSASAASFTTLLIVQSDFESGLSRGPGIIEVETVSSDLYLDYPLVVECFPHSGGVKVKMIYDVAVISAWSARMMAKHFEQLLGEIECYSDPSTAIMDLKLLGPETAAEVLGMSCGRLVEHRECLHERIFTKATAWEADDALHGWDAKYTYHELHRLVRRLAVRLSPSLKSTTGKVVPICYPKSAAAIVAMLATLSAGHAFLMVDATLPVQRIKYMLEAVEADRVVCSSDTRRLVDDVGLLPVDFEDMMNTTPCAPECLGDARSSVSPDEPAYCMFTSGSTGSPKGVLLLHKQATSGLEAQCGVGLYRRKTRLLQFSSYGFDTCIADIFATLLSGGCVCIPEDRDRLVRISENINDFSATAIDLTPSVARLIHPDSVPKLQTLRLGGEPMHHHHVQTWANRCNLQNTYGPTECCVQCTFVDRVPDSMSPSVIGKGIGCHTWIVDPQNHNHLTPLGAIGELAIQGPAVAKGYLNDPAKSKVSFLPKAPWLDTYNVDCHFPTYLTGDLVRFDEQGNLVFVGRKDDQIKIRGQRVEPEEIEHILQQDQFTRQAVVCYPTAGIMEFQLVALLEPSFDLGSSSSSGADTQQLPLSEHTLSWMRRCAQKAADFLPHYMVPAVYVSADKTLLMSSGKLDRRRLQKWLEQLSSDQLDCLDVYRKAATSNANSSLPDLPESAISPIVEQIRHLLSWKPDSQAANFSTQHSFSHIGLDSITIVPLLTWVNKTYRAEMDMQKLLRLETAYNLACYLHNRTAQEVRENGVKEEHEMFQDIILKGVSQLCRVNNSSDPWSTVLLTGGSSLVGLNILLGLLHRFPLSRVAVLKRCEDTAVGKKGLVEKLGLLGSWRDDYADRIEIWPGDLSLHQFGLAPSHWLRLIGRGDLFTNVECVIHNAATVNWFQGFQSLKRVNIDATIELVECVRDSPSMKRLIYVSGGPQWDPGEAEEAMLKGHVLEDAVARSNAYGQTKMIASTIIQQAAARSPRLAAKVFTIRPALIVGSSTDGVPNVDDFIWRVVMGCYAIRAFPEESKGSWIYLCGADGFADMVIDSLSAPPRPCETRVDNGLSVDDFWDAVNQELDGQLERRDYGTWLQCLKESISENGLRGTENHQCQPILHMLESSPEVLGAPAPRSAADAEWRQRMQQESARVVRRNIRYMADIGCFTQAESIWSAKVFNRTKVLVRGQASS